MSHMFLINLFEGKHNKILPLDQQWSSIETQLILMISMHSYLIIQCLQLSKNTDNIQTLAFPLLQLFVKTEVRQSDVQGTAHSQRASVVCLLHQPLTSGGERSSPIVTVSSWRPRWILSVGPILYHEHPMLKRKQETQYAFNRTSQITF